MLTWLVGTACGKQRESLKMSSSLSDSISSHLSREQECDHVHVFKHFLCCSVTAGHLSFLCV